MKYIGLLLLGLILGGTVITAAAAPSWQFTAVSVALLILAVGYALSALARVLLCRRNSAGEGDRR